MTIKKFIKRMLPLPIFKFLKKTKKRCELFSSYLYDFKRFSKYSLTFGVDEKNQLEAIIIKHYHIIEKGLTMPERRLGFGQDMVIDLSNDCLLFSSKYKCLSKQVIHAIAVLKEYNNLHQQCDYNLNDKTSDKLSELFKRIDISSIHNGTQLEFNKEQYFQYTNSTFDMFSNSRKSVRNYSRESIPEDKLKSALTLALNTPSACNRQATKLYVYTDKNKIKEILALQNGNRGFGHLASALIVISADLGYFGDTMERNQAFIDGGMFAMNLLYCLHHYNIAGCILNCSNIPKQDKQIQKVSNIPPSQVFIAMISCGLPPEEFMVASSLRYDLNDICKID